MEKMGLEIELAGTTEMSLSKGQGAGTRCVDLSVLFSVHLFIGAKFSNFNLHSITHCPWRWPTSSLLKMK